MISLSDYYPDRDRHTGENLRGEGPSVRSLQERRQRLAVGSRYIGKVGEIAHLGICCRSGSNRFDYRPSPLGVTFEEIASHASQHNSVKSVSVVGSQPQDGHGTGRKSDGVDRIVTQFAKNPVL